MRQYIAETSANVMGGIGPMGHRARAPSQPKAKLQLQCTVSFFMDMGVCAVSQGLKKFLKSRFAAGDALRAPRARARSVQRSRVEKNGLENPILGVFWPFSDPKHCRVRSCWDFFCNFGAFGACFGEN